MVESGVGDLRHGSRGCVGVTRNVACRIDDVVGLLPFKEASSPLVSGTRPMAFGPAELEVSFVDVNAMAADAFMSNSFALVCCVSSVIVRSNASCARGGSW